MSFIIHVIITIEGGKSDALQFEAARRRAIVLF